MRVRIVKLRRGRCMACGSALGFFRSLTGSAFCCEEHQKQYLLELREAALNRLRNAGTGHKQTRFTVV